MIIANVHTMRLHLIIQHGANKSMLVDRTVRPRDSHDEDKRFPSLDEAQGMPVRVSFKMIFHLQTYFQTIFIYDSAAR